MIIEQAIRAGDLPEHLRAGVDPEAAVLVTVRPLTANGFTKAFEAGVLQAERDVEGEPFRPAADVFEELKLIAAEKESPASDQQ